MTLDQIFDHGAAAAQELFDQQGAVQPMWIAQTKDGGILPIIISNMERESKDAVIDELKRMFREHDVVRYVSILEAWALSIKTKDALPDSVRLGAPISQHPDRREIIALVAEDKSEGVLSGHFFILRPEHGKPKLSKLERMPKNSPQEGRFSGLLA
jgi:hypothetical protein